jgi:YD repeat-containing protein
VRCALLAITLSLVSCHAHVDARWPGWQGRTCQVRFEETGSTPTRKGLLLVAIEGDQARLLEAQYQVHWTSDVSLVRERHRYDAQGRHVETVSAGTDRDERVTVSYDDQGRMSARELATRYHEVSRYSRVLDLPKQFIQRCAFDHDRADRMTRLENTMQWAGRPAETHVSRLLHLRKGQPVEAPRDETTYVAQYDDRGRWVGTEIYFGDKHVYSDRYQWDDADRLRTWFRDNLTEPPWHERYERDATDRLIRRIDSAGDIRGEFTYDHLGRPVTAIERQRRFTSSASHALLVEPPPVTPYLATTTTTFAYEGCDPFPDAARLLVDQHLTPVTVARRSCELQSPTLPVAP